MTIAIFKQIMKTWWNVSNSYVGWNMHGLSAGWKKPKTWEFGFIDGLQTFSFSSEHPPQDQRNRRQGCTQMSANPRTIWMESQRHTLTGLTLLPTLKLCRGSAGGGTIRSPCLTSCASHTIVFHPFIHVLSQITQIWLNHSFYKGSQTSYKALQDEEKTPFFFFLFLR